MLHNVFFFNKLSPGVKFPVWWNETALTYCPSVALLPPLCVCGSAHHILLQLEVSELDKSADVEVTLRTENLATQQRLML